LTVESEALRDIAPERQQNYNSKTTLCVSDGTNTIVFLREARNKHKSF